MSKMSEIKNNKLVCVTGQVNKGKTTAIQFISSLGYNIFIMDEYIHEIYKKNKIGYLKIKENFGEGFVNDIEVNRDKLRNLILSDSKYREKLNSIMFPIMFNKLLEIKNSSKHIVFVELGIYIYNPEFFNNVFDLVIAINRDDKLTKRNPFQKIKNVVKFSTKGVENLKNNDNSNMIFVDFIVDNNETLEKFKMNIKKILEYIDK